MPAVFFNATSCMERLMGEGMAHTFEGTWADLRISLKPGTAIENWGARNGYTGAGFKVDGIDRGTSGKRSPRSISREDFRRVFNQWPSYRAGKIGRAELGQITGSRNTTYILSLLHWLEA